MARKKKNPETRALEKAAKSYNKRIKELHDKHGLLYRELPKRLTKKDIKSGIYTAEMVKEMHAGIRRKDAHRLVTLIDEDTGERGARISVARVNVMNALIRAGNTNMGTLGARFAKMRADAKAFGKTHPTIKQTEDKMGDARLSAFDPIAEWVPQMDVPTERTKGTVFRDITPGKGGYIQGVKSIQDIESREKSALMRVEGRHVEDGLRDNLITAAIRSNMKISQKQEIAAHLVQMSDDELALLFYGYGFEFVTFYTEDEGDAKYEELMELIKKAEGGKLQRIRQKSRDSVEAHARERGMPSDVHAYRKVLAERYGRTYWDKMAGD